MRKRRSHAGRPHATKEEIRAALIELLASPNARTLLPKNTGGLTESQCASCRIPATLHIPSVRRHVLMGWAQLRRCPQATQADVQRVADQCAHWIVSVYLPAWRKQLSDLTAELMRQLTGLLGQLQEPAALLADSEGADQGKSTTRTSYSAVLCMPSIRAQICTAWADMTASERSSTKACRSRALPILEAAMEFYRDLLGDADIERFTVRSAYRAEDHANRITAACDLLGSSVIPVEALQPVKVDGARHSLGTRLDVGALTFLEQSHQEAAAVRPARSRPVFLASGRTHAARRADICARILAFLGQLRRESVDKCQPVWVSRNELTRAITGHKGGPRYAQIWKFTTGLDRLGLVVIDDAAPDRGGEKAPKKIALAVPKKVKYLKNYGRQYRP